jgi:hypothetical protein
MPRRGSQSLISVLLASGAVATALVAVGCGATRTVTTTVTVGSKTTTPSTTSSKTSGESMTAGQLVSALRCASLPIGRFVNYTERTDPNHLLGRPGGYVSKTNWVDTRIKNPSSNFDVQDGGSIEVFPDPTDAKGRFEYVTRLSKTAGSLFSEYDYLLNRIVLLRVSTTLIPSEAAAYRTKADEILANPKAAQGSCRSARPKSPRSAKPPRPLNALNSRFIGGNASPHLPSGKAGQIAVVATGRYNGNVLPVVVRNNTSGTKTAITVTGTANTHKGNLLATGGDQGFYPNVVRPGEIAIGYVYFGGKRLNNVVFRLKVTGTPQAEDTYGNRIDLQVKQPAHRNGSIVGYLKNESSSRVTGPIQAYVQCFSKTGGVLGQYSAFTDKDSASPGEMVPFMVDLSTLSGSASCPVFLVAGGGYTS